MEWGGSGAPGLLYLIFHTVSLLAKSHSPSAEACPAGVDFLGQLGRVPAALPAGLAAEMLRLESPNVYFGTPGASTGLSLCAKSK